MTNVPQNIRDMWADVYRLFDSNFNIKNDAESWHGFWKQAESLMSKYNQDRFLGALILLVSEMLEAHVTDKKYFPHTLEDMNLF